MLTCTLMLVVSIALTIGFILSIDAGLQLLKIGSKTCQEKEMDSFFLKLGFGKK